jgi:hypothetical protein
MTAAAVILEALGLGVIASVALMALHDLRRWWRR